MAGKLLLAALLILSLFSYKADKNEIQAEVIDWQPYNDFADCPVHHL